MNEVVVLSFDEVVCIVFEVSRVLNLMEIVLLLKKDFMSYEIILELLDMEMCLDGVIIDNGEGIDGVV